MNQKHTFVLLRVIERNNMKRRVALIFFAILQLFFSNALGASHSWSQRFGDSNDQLAWDVAVDEYRNTIVAGSFTGNIDFGAGTLVSSGGSDIFFVKFDQHGDCLWSFCFGDTNDQGALSVAVNGPGNVIITGVFEGSVDFGGGVLTSLGSEAIFVAEFDNMGNQVWSRSFGGFTAGCEPPRFLRRLG